MEHWLLSFEERNALRLVAGYVRCKVRTQLETSSIPEKGEVIMCIVSFAGDEEVEGEETELWLHSVDRAMACKWHHLYIFHCHGKGHSTPVHYKAIGSAVARKLQGTNDRAPDAQWRHTVSVVLSDYLHSRIGGITVAPCNKLLNCTSPFMGSDLQRLVWKCMFKQQTKQNLQHKKALRKHIVFEN